MDDVFDFEDVLKDVQGCLLVLGDNSVYDGECYPCGHYVQYVSTCPYILSHFSTIITLYKGEDARDFFFFHKKFGGNIDGEVQGKTRHAWASLGYGSTLHVYTLKSSHNTDSWRNGVTHAVHSLEHRPKNFLWNKKWIPFEKCVELPFYYETGDFSALNAGNFVFNCRNEDRGFWENKKMNVFTEAPFAVENVTPS